MRRRARHAVLAVAIGAITLDTALLGLIVPLLPEVAERTGAGEAGIGLALAAYAIPIAAVSIPFGLLADRIGRRPLLIGGLTLTVVGSLLIAASESLGPLIAGRAVQGTGSAASWIAALALVADLAPPGRKGEAIGFALAANGGGAIAGPALGGVTGDAFGFAAPFLIVAALGLALAAAGFVLLPRARPEPTEPRRALSRALAVARRPEVWPATAIVVGAAAALGVVEVVAPLDLDERLGLSATVIGLLFASAIAVNAMSSPLAGRAGDHLGRRPVATAGLIALAASAAALALLGGTGGAIVGLAAFGAGVGTSFAAAVPWLDDQFGALDRGMAYGALNLLFSIGYTVGPLLAGTLYEAVGPELPYLTLAGLAVAGAALIGLTRPAVPAPSAET